MKRWELIEKYKDDVSNHDWREFITDVNSLSDVQTDEPKDDFDRLKVELHKISDSLVGILKAFAPLIK